MGLFPKLKTLKTKAVCRLKRIKTDWKVNFKVPFRELAGTNVYFAAESKQNKTLLLIKDIVSPK
jgi:hypothetical protein